MNIVLLIFEFTIQISYSQEANCQNLTMIPNTTYYANQFDRYILEGEEEDYININKIDQEILERQFIIPYEEEPIQIKIINSIEEEKIEEKLICSLFLTSQYIIRCIKFESIYFSKNNSFVEKIKLETNISSQEICDEMHFQNDGFILLCSKNNFLIKYHITLLNQIKIDLVYDVSSQIQDRCKKQQFCMQNNQIFIMYYQCSKWLILQMDKQQFYVILEYNMIEEYPSISQFSFIYDISFCLKQKIIFFFLIEKNQYINLIYNIPNYFKYIQFEKYERELQKIVADYSCIHTIMILKIDEPNNNFNEYQIAEIGLQEYYKTKDIHYHSDFIFLQNKTQLTILIDLNLNKTYNILDTQLTFFRQYNLFFQIDSYNKVLQFYRYFPLNTFIKPKLKYLFLISKSSFNKNLVVCYKIQYENKNQVQIQNQIMVPIQITCQKIQQFFYPQKQFISLEYFSYPLFKKEINMLNVSIWNNQKFDLICYKNFMNQHNFADIYLKQIVMNNYLYLITKSLLFIFDCQNNQILTKININQITVFQYGDEFYLYGQDNNTIKVIQILPGEISASQINFNKKIQRIKQIQSHLIINIKNQKLPLLLEILTKQLFQLSNNLYQNEEILYYQKIGDFYFIHYPNVFILELKQNVKCFKLQEVHVFYISTWVVSIQFQIFAVKNQTNTIMIYYLDQFQILEMSNFTFSNYNLSYPLQYITSISYFVILVEKNNFQYLAILYRYQNSLILNDIIQTASTNFIFYQNTLLYYDVNKVLRQKYLFNLVLEVQIQQIWHEFFTSYEMELTLFEKEENYTSYQNFQLLIQNTCQNLYSKQQKIEINLIQGQKFQVKLQNYFFGPINYVTLQNLQTKLKGPLQFNLKISDCTDDTSFFCFRQYYSESEKNMKTLHFTALILQNQIILKNLHKFISTQVLDSFWIMDSNYLLIIDFDGSLQFSLITLSNETFFEISNLITQIQVSQIDKKIIKIGNLILIKDSNYNLYWVQNLTIIKLQISDNFLDLLYIENSSDLYVSLIRLYIEHNFDIELKIYTMSLKEYKIIYNRIITQELNILFSQYFLYTSDKLQDFIELQLVQCKIESNTIIMEIYFLFKQFSFLTKFQIDILNDSISYFQLIKQIRNHGDNYYSQMKIHYLDDNFLVLKQLDPQFFFLYDLRQDIQFLDYIQNISQEVQIQRINNTHYIFTNQQDAHLGMFGYEIEFENSYEGEYSIVLQAENSISSAEFHLQITINQSKFNYQSTIVIQLLFNMLFIIIYINKYQQKRNRAKQINRVVE
ncbi:unnamed protein product [Paramecium sonneborni]|uniref:Transmembrane protein n=1 Tax=Paramecium sonneborni TaxID=65129 RepID=A0A8S1MMR3_9CILI|nr:unnamed protein product [Paramecium sonneborni]